MARDNIEERWQIGYNHLVDYYNKNGNSKVPQRYVCEDGYKLGAFCEGQKLKKSNGTLKADREKMLEKVEFEYRQKRKTLTWNEWYILANDYYDEYGDLDVPINYITPNGYKLGVWVNEQAKAYREGLISDNHIIKLNKLEMKWCREEDNWYQRYDSLYAYYLKHGDVNLPVNYTDDNGNNLYRWLHYQMEKLREGSLTKEQVDCLSEFKITPSKKQNKWQTNYNKLYRLYKEHENIDVAIMFASFDSNLKNWMYNQKNKYSSNKANREEVKKLNSIYFDWSVRDTKYLNNNIVDDIKYKKIMLARMKHILEDLSYEIDSNITSSNRQEEINKEIIKRMWR